MKIDTKEISKLLQEYALHIMVGLVVFLMLLSLIFALNSREAPPPGVVSDLEYFPDLRPDQIRYRDNSRRIEDNLPHIDTDFTASLLSDVSGKLSIMVITFTTKGDDRFLTWSSYFDMPDNAEIIYVKRYTTDVEVN